MSLVLTTSRNPSIRTRQFLKDFSLIFPATKVKIFNRGKLSLSELFNKCSKFSSVLIISSHKGNPKTIVGYQNSGNDRFDWIFDIKLRYVKLHFELNSTPLINPESTVILFGNFQSDLKSKIILFFENLVEFEIGKLEQLESKKIIILKFNYENPGFKILNYFSHDIETKLSPEIGIDEIISS